MEKRTNNKDQLKFRFKIQNRPMNMDNNIAMKNVSDREVVLLGVGVSGENLIRVADGSPEENFVGPIT
tara:strand:- start:89 stop:292 length:204 start_codon:yes stop_codon:yes gene_type:complete